jgi:outer membrane protein TolC
LPAALLLLAAAARSQSAGGTQPDSKDYTGEILTREQAMEQALLKNFDIRISRNDLEIARRNSRLLNSGYLPTVTATTGGNINVEDQEATFRTGEAQSVDGAQTTRYNASVNVSYTLFDGLGRMYRYKGLKETYKLTELQVRETIENTLLQLFTVYFEVARLSENVGVLRTTYQNTAQRLQRAEYGFDYGRGSKLDVLNAEVDLVSDSINLITELQTLRNAKRDLNVILNRDILKGMEVDTSITFLPRVQLDNWRRTAEFNNAAYQQAVRNVRIGDLSYKQSKSLLLPSIQLNGSYGWNRGEFPPTGFLLNNTNQGFGAGVSLNWNIFDGGQGTNSIRNNRINRESLKWAMESLRLQLQANIANALDTYENRLQVYSMQKSNVKTALNNYERSREQYRVGRITSIELRQAQINYINAQTNRNFAKYNAKLAELELLRLFGQLLNVKW